MRTDTLRYKYGYNASQNDLYNTLVNEQLKYFQRTNPQIRHLTPGTTIEAELTTKMKRIATTNKMSIKNMVKNELFQMETEQPDGKIVQTYQFETNKRGKKFLVYSERNTFKNTRNQTNFMFISLLYKFFYNRGVRKRMKYLDDLAVN
ncbi:DUF3284 domain-containing protein [Companilactobacillus sp. FL22-1]|uniref:DUF3284 domain-containing protein n=1 Tax=Companilactobacillus sp. FL22-1 TaxID=3373892 RepID=UPI003754D21A